MSTKRPSYVEHIAHITFDVEDYDDAYFQHLSELYEIKVKLIYGHATTKVWVQFTYEETEFHDFSYDLYDIIFGSHKLRYERAQKLKYLKK